jgi:hypothetical protein
VEDTHDYGKTKFEPILGWPDLVVLAKWAFTIGLPGQPASWIPSGGRVAQMV